MANKPKQVYMLWDMFLQREIEGARRIMTAQQAIQKNKQAVLKALNTLPGSLWIRIEIK